MTYGMRGLVTGVLFLAVALTPVVAVSGSFEDARDAYNSGDYATAERLWRPLAEQGDADAQFYLGVMYENGQGVPQNYAEALKWHQLAAEQGNAGAQYNLGLMYSSGQQGVPQDFLRAHIWFNLAGSRLPAGADRDKAVEGRDFAATQMPAAQVAEAQKLAHEWRPRGVQAE